MQIETVAGRSLPFLPRQEPNIDGWYGIGGRIGQMKPDKTPSGTIDHWQVTLTVGFTLADAT